MHVSGVSGAGTLTLYDLNDTQILRQQAYYNDGPVTLLLRREDGSRLASGVYFVHVHAPGKSYPVLKLAVISE